MGGRSWQVGMRIETFGRKEQVRRREVESVERWKAGGRWNNSISWFCTIDGEASGLPNRARMEG